MAGANSAYNQTQAFNKELYDPTGRGAGLQNDFKNQLSTAAGNIANASGRKGRNQGVQALHQLIWNNPNIPNELKQALADYATYQPRGVRGDGTALKQTMGGDVVPAPRPGSKRARNKPAPAPEPAEKPKKKRMKAKTASMPEPASPPPTTQEPTMTNARRRRVKAMEE